MVHGVQQHSHQHHSHNISPPPLKRRRIADDGHWQPRHREQLAVEPVPAIRENLDTTQSSNGPVTSLRRHSSLQSSLSHETVPPRHPASSLHSHDTKERRLWHSDIGVTKTDAHTRKPICRACGRTQHLQYDPIITCIKCRRQYHDSCRNPALAAGDDGQLWKCFKCLPGGRRRSTKFPSLPGGYNPTVVPRAIQPKTFSTPSILRGQQKLKSEPMPKQLNHGDRKPRPLQERQRAHESAFTAIDRLKTKRMISRQSVLDSAVKAAGFHKPSIKLDKDRAHDRISHNQHASKQGDARRSSIKEIPDSPEVQSVEPADVSLIVKWQQSVEHTASGEMDDVSLIELSQHDRILNPERRFLKHQKHGDFETMRQKMTDHTGRASEVVIPNTPDSLNFEETDQTLAASDVSVNGCLSRIVVFKFSKSMIPVVRQILRLAPKRSPVSIEKHLGAVKETAVTSQTNEEPTSISSLSVHETCIQETSSFQPINQATPPTVAEPKRPIDDHTHRAFKGQSSERDKADVDIMSAPETIFRIGSYPQTEDDGMANLQETVEVVPHLRHTLQTKQDCAVGDTPTPFSPDNPSASYPSPNSSRAVSADVHNNSSKKSSDISDSSKTYTLREIAGMALAAAKGTQCTSAQVISWATHHFSDLRPGEAWESSLRCTLSLSPEFKSQKLINAPRRNMKSYSFTDGIWRAHYEQQYSQLIKSPLGTSSPKSGSKTNSSRAGVSSATQKQPRGNLRDRAGLLTCDPVPVVPSSLRFEVKGSLLADQITSTHEKVSSLAAIEAVTNQMLVGPADSGAKSLPIGAWTAEEKAQKIASIKARPSRKHFFGSDHRLAHKRRHGLQDIHDERHGAWKPQSVRKDLLTKDKSGHANLTDGGSLRDLFDLPENVIPINDGVGELAFRDATLVNGKLPRSRPLYRVGKIVAGELTIRSS